jgi:hypothetical protein
MYKLWKLSPFFPRFQLFNWVVILIIVNTYLLLSSFPVFNLLTV